MFMESYLRLVPDRPDELRQRAGIHAALGEPARLAIVDLLAVSDRSPTELCEHLQITTNLLTHHLDVLAAVGLVSRTTSAGDKRRKYVRLERAPLASLAIGGTPLPGRTLFLCTHNSARSQLAAALWSARTGRPSDSAGTHPADRVHRGAIAAGRRAGLDLSAATPKTVDVIEAGTQVVTVCDRAHEELTPDDTWWHWSIPDPVETGDADAIDAVVADLDARITTLLSPTNSTTGVPQP